MRVLTNLYVIAYAWLWEGELQSSPDKYIRRKLTGPKREKTAI